MLGAWQKIPLVCFFESRAIPALPKPVQSRRQWKAGRPVSCFAGQVRWMQEQRKQEKMASVFLRCRSVRGSGAAMCAARLDAPVQAAQSSAQAYQLRGWKLALPGIPALRVRGVPDW